MGTVSTPSHVPQVLIVLVDTGSLPTAGVCLCLSQGFPWPPEWAGMLGNYAHSPPGTAQQALTSDRWSWCVDTPDLSPWVGEDWGAFFMVAPYVL